MWCFVAGLDEKNQIKNLDRPIMIDQTYIKILGNRLGNRLGIRPNPRNNCFSYKHIVYGSLPLRTAVTPNWLWVWVLASPSWFGSENKGRLINHHLKIMCTSLRILKFGWKNWQRPGRTSPSRTSSAATWHIPITSYYWLYYRIHCRHFLHMTKKSRPWNHIFLSNMKPSDINNIRNL